METGVYNKKKPHIPKPFDKQLYNNILAQDLDKHKTPMGAGMTIWANNKIALQPATLELNYEKIQTSIVIIKTQNGNYNILQMSLHTPNRLTLIDKEK